MIDFLVKFFMGIVAFFAGFLGLRNAVASMAKKPAGPAASASTSASGKYTIRYVLYNLATGRSDVTAALPVIRDALDEQANGPFAAAHGGSYAFRVGAHPSDRAKDEVAINIRHTVPAQGAVAYHAVTNGIADIEVALDLVQGLTQGAESLSVAISHEVLETNGDEGANLWATRQDGQTADARENCDWTQNVCYSASNGVSVTNFLLPSAWIPGAAGPWDYMKVMKSQYDMSNGYGIKATVGNIVMGASTTTAARHVTYGGSLTELQRKRKAHPFSRASRRGLVIS